jgi:putative ABC transport system permease protein
MRKNPPKIFLRFFRWYCHPKLLDHIEGDLIEVHEQRLKKVGKKKADIKFIVDVILLFRPGIIKPIEGHHNLINHGMFKSYFKIGWRNLVRNKGYSFINIGGLALGIASFLLIMLYVNFEDSYEDFVPNRSLIYRVTLTKYVNGEQVQSSAENYPSVGPILAATFPEIASYARLYNLGYKNNVVITNEGAQPQPIAINQRKFLYADSAFLPMMGYHLIMGDVTTALAEPNSAVLTQRLARLYFGDADPLGKILRMHDDDNNDEQVKVTGVINEIPSNTHLKFDVLFSYRTLYRRNGKRPGYALERFEQTWQRNDMYTFVQVRPGTNARELEAKFPALVQAHNPKERNQNDILSLQPLADIHLTSHVAEEPELNGDERIVNFLWIIGFFVLVIAWVNYINLSTAKAMERAREVGVRKVMGAFKFQLVRMFLAEAVLIYLLSILLAVAMVGVALPAFNSLSGLSLDVSYLIRPWFLGLLGILWIGGALFSGFYPAVVLSSFKPISILKGKLANSVGGVYLRKSLVVCQFMASVVLIAGTLIVFKQLNFLMSRDIGMNINQVLVIERPGIGPHRTGFNSAVESFRDELKKNPDIQFVTGSHTIPGKQREDKEVVKRYGTTDNQSITVRSNSMDYEFMDVFEMKLLAGRGFSKSYIKDADTSVLITESASRLLGFKSPEDAIGQTLSLDWPWNPIVVGVVNDYHQISLKKSLEPGLFYCDPYEGEFYSIRLTTKHLPQAIDHIKASWEKAFPGNPFDYFFLDDYFNQQYKNERRFGALFTTFASLALIIGCLGLFGLSAYTAMQRTKEIGIRKVLGSTVREIFFLLSKEYLKLVLLSIVLAVPLVYFVMSSWIQTFAYRAPITGVVFLEAGVAVLLISLITVSFQTLRAAGANPVQSLRSE